MQSLPGVIKQILATVVMFLKNPDDFNYANPLVFNVAAFLDPLATSKFLYTLASAMDVFVIWGVILMAIGLSSASKRLHSAARWRRWWCRGSASC